MFDIIQRDAMIDAMRRELTDYGVRELRSPEEVDAVISAQKGTILVFVNSVCGCAAGAARPGLKLSFRSEQKPDEIVTVFAGQDREATERARSYFKGFQPSSPSAYLLKNGEVVAALHRHQIEGRNAEQVALQLEQMFAKFCN
ncbi:MAG: BrxA/BrxB family bacilliredoxin [Chloroherpetonaceae bacterium]|nr:BrxA/BrxB family bacilliredoxin [Chloroherpetonaceae bacterium]